MDPFRNLRRPSLGSLWGPPGPVPRDLLALLAVVFVTFSMQFFASTRIVPELLRLTPRVWQAGFVWQLVTYPFSGIGAPSLWFLLELLILFLFGRTVRSQLGRRRFWRLLAGVAAAAAVLAVGVELLRGAVAGPAAVVPFQLMQGQHMLLVILVAAFATLNRHAVIYLFFVLPIPALWFLPLEILFAFMGFLATKDLAGLVGVCGAVGLTWATHGGWGRGSGRRLWLRLQQLWLRLRLGWRRRRRGLQVLPGGGEGGRRDPWLH